MILRNTLKWLVLNYLRIGAKIQLFKIRPKIIGVGGASGKTSTASFIETILEGKHSVLATHGKNSETGIPLSILRIHIKNYSLATWIRVVILVPIKILFDFKKYDFLVVEMGIDGLKPPQNMEYLLRIVKPHVGVLTNITHEHSLNFEVEKDDSESEIFNRIAKEELKLLESIRPEGKTIVNLDDDYIQNNKNLLKAEKITVSLNKKADFRIENVKVTERSFVMDFIYNGQGFKLRLKKVLPFYYSYSFLLAIATCFTQGISIEESIGTLQNKFVLPPGRSGVFKGIKNSTIIDSSYNSSYEPAAGMLELLNEIGKNRRKLAIIGDMRELGKVGKKLHENLAKKIIENADYCILVGPLTKEFIAPVLEEKKFPFKHFNNFSELKYRLIDLVKERDLILVKASQNTLLLERIVELLLDNKDDVKDLARRGEHWDKIRASTS